MAAGGSSVRVNPELDVDVEVTGALLTVRDMKAALRAVVRAGSAALEGVSGALDLRLTAGSAVIAGAPRDGDWRLSSESAAVELVLDRDTGAKVTVTGRHSRVDALGSETHAVLGTGSRAIDIEAAFSDVVVRAA